MDDPTRVRRGEGLNRCTSEGEDLVRRQPPPREARGQGLALQVLHHDERAAIRRLAHLVDHAHMRMIERRRRARLPLQARTGLGVAGQRRGGELQGDAASEDRVFRQEDFAHAAFTNLAEDAVMPDGHRRRPADVPMLDDDPCRARDDVAECIVGGVIVNQERLDVAAQIGIALADRRQSCGAGRGIAVDDIVEELAHAPPASRVDLSVTGLAHRFRILQQPSSAWRVQAYSIQIREEASMKWHSTLAVLILTLACASGARATTLTVTGGILTGATNVSVGGSFYDVIFVDGTCAAVFDGCDDPADFIFPTSATAVAASQALLDQVFLDGPLGHFDSNPNLTFGCSGTFVCQVLTPYLVSGTNMFAGDAQNFDTSGFGTDGAISLTTLNADLSQTGAKVFAKWTPAAPTPVPEPASLTLVGLGLATVAASRRRRQR
jgi:hypothetical protein